MKMELSMGNIFIRKSEYYKKGDIVETHEHNFDHVTYFPEGRWIAEKLAPVVLDDGSPVLHEGRPTYNVLMKKEFNKGSSVLIDAGVRHRFTALEDGSRYGCIYAHRTAQGDIVQ